MEALQTHALHGLEVYMLRTASIRPRCQGRYADPSVPCPILPKLEANRVQA